MTSPDNMVELSNRPNMDIIKLVGSDLNGVDIPLDKDTFYNFNPDRPMRMMIGDNIVKLAGSDLSGVEMPLDKDTIYNFNPDRPMYMMLGDNVVKLEGDLLGTRLAVVKDTIYKFDSDQPVHMMFVGPNDKENSIVLLFILIGLVGILLIIVLCMWWYIYKKL